MLWAYPAEHRLELPHAEPPTVQHPVQSAFGQSGSDVTQVEKRPRPSRHRNSSAGVDVGLVEPAGPPCRDPLPGGRVVLADEDLDALGLELPKPPEMGGAAMGRNAIH